MVSLETQEQAVSLLRNTDMRKPIGMLNMLKFRAMAAYTQDMQEPAATGAQAYTRYGAGVMQIFGRTGAHVILDGALALIGPQGEWDRVFVVHYPQRQMLLDLILDPAYRKIVHHRQAALQDSRLFALEFTETDFSV